MKVVKCKNGHFYNRDKFEKCPFCGSAENNRSEPEKVDDEVTQALEAEAALADDGPTEAYFEFEHEKQEKEELPEAPVLPSSHVPAGVTEPVVGWLVCMSGAERGRDYRLCEGRNLLGSAESMDIRIAGDDGVSRENHCSVIYDPRSGKYLLIGGEGEQLTLNGEEIDGSAGMKDGDIIGIGDTQLCFVAYCTDERKW